MESSRGRGLGGLLAAGVVLIAAGLTWVLWPAASDAAPSVPAVSTPGGAGGEAAASVPSVASGAATRRAEREPEVVVAATRPSAEELWGRVVTAADERPIADAEVVLQYRDADEFWNLDLEYGARVDVLATTRSGPDGRFRFPLPRALQHRLRVTAAGFAPRTVLRVTGGSEVLVRMSAGATVEGRVREQGTGRPLADVPVRAARYGESDELAAGVTAADGTFRFTGLPALKNGVVMVRPTGHVAPDWRRLEWVDGQVHRLDFELVHGRSAHGVVTDAATGAPVPGAEVSDSWTFDRRVRTDVDGKYLLAGLGEQEELHVRAAGYAHQLKRLLSEPKEPQVDFVLVRGGTVRGRFVDHKGAPVPSAYAAVGASFSATPGYVHTDWVRASVAPDGQFTAEGLDPGQRYSLYVRGRGLGTRVYALPVVKNSEVLDLGDVALLAGGGLEGRVVDTHGRPLDQASVSLRGGNADTSRWLKGAPQGFMSPVHQFESRSTRSATDGSFRFAGVAAGSYQLSVTPAGRSWDAASGPHEVRDGEVRTDVNVVVDFGLSITGTVRTADGSALPQTESFTLCAWAPSEPQQNARVTPDGTFRFERLKEGSYVLTAMRAPEGLVLSPVRNVAAGTDGLQLVLQPAATITGRVVTADGKPARARLSLWYRERISSSSALYPTDAEGRFSLSVPPDFEGEVHAQDLDNRWPSAQAKDVRAGARDLVLTLGK